MGTKWWQVALFVVVMVTIAALLHPTRLRLGWMFVKSGRAIEAIANLTKAYQDNPKDYRALKYLAQALENAGRPEDAKKMYESLVQAKPRDENFREIARFYVWTGKAKEAKWAYEKWFDYRQNNHISFDNAEGTEILDNLYALSMQFKDYKKAIEVINVRRQLNPAYAEMSDTDLIKLYEMTGDLSATMAQIEHTLKFAKKDAYALDKFIELAPVAGKMAEARNYLIQAVLDNPGDVKARKRLISFEANNKNYAAVSSWYLRWIAQAPGNQPLKNEYVDWLLGTEQQKPAVEFIEGLPEEDRKNFKDTLVKLYEWNNMKEKLVDPYFERFNENPGDRENARKLVWLLIDLKQDQKAEGVLKHLVELYPGDEEYAGILADIYDREGKTGSSIAVLENAVRKNKDPKLMKRLGELYLFSAD